MRNGSWPAKHKADFLETIWERLNAAQESGDMEITIRLNDRVSIDCYGDSEGSTLTVDDLLLYCAVKGA
jgi:hypothetical protein